MKPKIYSKCLIEWDNEIMEVGESIEGLYVNHFGFTFFISDFKKEITKIWKPNDKGGFDLIYEANTHKVYKEKQERTKKEN